MISLYWLIALFSGSFFLLYWFQEKRRTAHITQFQLLLFYFGSRVIFLTQLQMTNKIVFNFFLDLLFLYGLQLWSAKKLDQESCSKAIAGYLANPFVLTGIVSSNPLRLLFLAGCGGILLLVAKKRKFSLERKLDEKLLSSYLGFSGGGYLYSLARDVQGVTYQTFDYSDETAPTVLVLGALLMAVCYGRMLSLVWRTSVVSEETKNIDDICASEHSCVTGKESQENDKAAQDREEGEEVLREASRRKFTKWDWIWMTVLTVLCAALVFWKLGSMEAPETTYTFDDDKDNQSQLIFTFDEEQPISKVYIYLGYQSKRTVSLSYLEEGTKEWTVLDSDINLEACFYWHELTMNQTVKALEIVEMDGEGVFHELVILDDEGNLVLPSNAEDYPALFDEQEKFPETATYYYRSMFDEIYHARTAYETLHGHIIYEISHPPLGKDLMSLGVAMFGMTPFGWRFVVALAGILLVPVMYAFLRKMTKKTKYAVAGSILLDVEFMHFTLSRIGTIDAIVAFFLLLAFYLMYCFVLKEHEYVSLVKYEQKEKERCKKAEILLLVLCGTAMGCAIATKWTGIYGAAGLAILLFAFLCKDYKSLAEWKLASRHLLILCITCIVSFIVIPIGIYLISYLPYTRIWEGGVVKLAIVNSIDMLKYHESTVFEHMYSSEWYEWAWMKNPLFDAVNQYPDGTYSFVATFGNPIIWWGGIVALFYNLYLWVVKKDCNAQYLCICYLSMLVPWIFIHRTLFIYQYYVPSLILIPMLMHTFANIKDPKNRKLILFVAAAVVVFCLFYPVISGAKVSKDYINHTLRWMSSWKFMEYGN